MSKVDKIVKEVNSESPVQDLNRQIAVALCEVDGINPNKEVYWSGGVSVPAWEYAIRDADKVRQVAIKLGWIKE